MDANLTAQIDQVMAEVDAHINHIMSVYETSPMSDPSDTLAIVCDYLKTYPGMTLEGLAAMTARCIQRMSQDLIN